MSIRTVAAEKSVESVSWGSSLCNFLNVDGEQMQIEQQLFCEKWKDRDVIEEFFIKCIDSKDERG